MSMRSSRFYFILYEVESPLKLRYQRFKTKYAPQKSITLEDFIELDDKIQFNTDEYALHNAISERSNTIARRFHNKTNKLIDFTNELKKFQFNNKELVRPNWDTYFMRLAEVSASRSNCMKRGIGAIIVKDNRVISTGYNGMPFGLQNCNEGGCQRCNDNTAQGLDLDKCLCLHAEESAVLEAGRKQTLGATMYCTAFACQLCAKMII